VAYTLSMEKTCNNCGRPVSKPYRSYFEGQTVNGCVAAAHTGHVHGLDAAWHNRPEAVQIRKDTAAHLRRLLA
jgi:hypothetical protein